MIPRTNILLDNTTGGRDNAGAAVTGAFTGDWYAFEPDKREKNVVGIHIAAGTGTIILEGRNGVNSAIATVLSVSAEDSESVVQFKQCRIRITGGAALQVYCSLDRIGRKVT
jgi:hypothetical protein